MNTTPTSLSSATELSELSELPDILRLKQLFATLPDSRVIGRVLHPLPELLQFTRLLWGGELGGGQVSIDGPAVAGSAAETRTAPMDAAPCISCEPRSARRR